ncbi:MAG: HDIG domain-containing protein [Pirellulaceae bacterium]|nr:HDIG domain-containing protein [Pirellulaceae bacterium]
MRVGIALSAMLALLVILEGWKPPFAYREGYVPPRALMSRVAFEVPDAEKTEMLRAEKRREVLCFYENNPGQLTQLSSALTGQLTKLLPDKSFDELDPEQLEALESLLPGKDGELEITREQAFLAIRGLLSPAGQNEKLARAMRLVLEPLIEHGILTSLSHELEDGNQRLIHVFSPGQSEQPVATDVARVRLAELAGELPQQKINVFQNEFGTPEAITVAKLVNAYLVPKLPNTLTYRQDLSEEARLKAENAIKPAMVSYSPSTSVLVRAGHPLSLEKDLPLLRAEYEAWVAQLTWTEMLVRASAFMGMVAALFLLCGIYLYYQIDASSVMDLRKLCSLLGLVLVTALMCHMLAADPWRAEVAVLVLCAITCTIAYGRQLAMLVTNCLALAVTLSLGMNLGEFVILASGTCSAVLLLGRIRSRTKLIYVGLATGLIVAMTHMGVDIMLGQIDAAVSTSLVGVPKAQPVTWQSLISNLAFESSRVGLYSLIACALMTSVLPFVEWFFGVQTDSSLLELGDASHPLLRQLAQRAPGTYNHSINVAAIAEAAADAIGAHGLLTRVGAYFHDIGKIFKPNYFVENQGQGGNRHESLQPAMSTLVIIAHVKDGADLARQHKLPKPIIDFIEQHHGTTLVEYFFREATKRSQQDPHGEEVSETTFRYPGPKPQTLEAAVLMLADAVESASRSLVEPTSSRIQNLVDDIAMKKLLDRQFDECGLTLKQLDLIKSSLVKSLNAIYHGRVKYPGQQTA